MTTTVAVVNPLAGALRHYTDALTEVLGELGHRVERFDIPEPSFAGTSRLRWLRRYRAALSAARSAATSDGLVLVTWPVLGYMDLVLFRIVGLDPHRTVLVIHDPDPLVRAIGLGSAGQRIARHLGAHAALLTHGDEAASVTRDHAVCRRVLRAPHPVRRHVLDAHVGDGAIRVLGSFKPDRDLALLEGIASHLGADRSLEIHGRGWPAVRGWSVTDEFVSEQRFDELVRSASVIVVPYRRVFQSGVAVRAVEAGTPFVGPRVTAHEDLCPMSPELLVDADAPAADRTTRWLAAIRAADDLDAGSRASLSGDAAERCVEAWRATLTGLLG